MPPGVLFAFGKVGPIFGRRHLGGAELAMKRLRTSPGRWADALLAGCVVLPPLLGGTVRGGPWLMAFVLAACAATAALASSERSSVGRPVLVVAALWGLSLLASLVPLPPELGHRLAPGAAFVSGLPGALDGWRPAHQAPGEGALHVLIWATAVLVALTASLRFGASASRVGIRRAVVASGGLAIAVCLAWTLTDGWASFGLYPRPKRAGLLSSPIVNLNHWSAWLSMVVGVSLGLALDERQRWTRVAPAGLVGLVSVGLIFASQSRGGMIGLAATLGVLALGWSRTADGGWDRRRLACAAGAGVVFLVPLAMGLQHGTHITRDRLSGSLGGRLVDEGRLLLLPDAADVVRAHPWLGAGRGAVADVLLRYQDVDSTSLRHWVEVLPVDLLLDHGLALGGALLVMLAFVVASAFRGALASRGAAGAGAAVVGLAVHELADFATFGGGVLLLAVVLAVLAMPRRGAEVGRKWGSAVVAVAVVVGLFAAQPALRHGDSRRCFERLLATEPDAAAVRAFAAEELPWHPASGALALEIGAESFRAGDPETSLRWLNRAQLLAPHHPEPHLWTARLLAAAGFAGQAAIEYRLAAAGDWPARGEAIAAELAASDAGLDALVRLAPPDDPDGPARVALWLERDHTELAFAVARAAQERSPLRALANLAFSHALLAAGEREQAADVLDAAWSRPEATDTSRLHIAEAMGRTDRVERALEMAREAQERAPDLSVTGWVTLGAYERRVGSPGAARAALRRARDFGVPRYTARSYCEEAALESGLGDDERALELYMRAADADHSWVQPLVWASELQVRTGAPKAARRTLELAMSRDPDNAEARRALATLEPDG
jgi:tetratricopeptide (TPR) repeat protein